MPRRLRFAPPGYWLHLTRSNNKQPDFSTDADRQHFLDLVELHSQERDVRVAAYTLMSNHIHLVAVGDHQDAISHFMREVRHLPQCHPTHHRPRLAKPLLFVRPQ